MAEAKKRQSFENSRELKRIFNQEFEVWKKRNHAGLNELAERCGVSSQYIAHIGRYGRIPSKPILILLALNFQLSNPRELFSAAGLYDNWPFDDGVGLRKASASDSGFLSINLDMEGLASAIGDVINKKIKPKTLKEFLGGRPLRVGMNLGQSFWFDLEKGSKNQGGFFPELIQLMGLALHVPIEFVPIEHFNYIDALKEGEIDLYGPIYYTAPRIGEAIYSNPFARVELGALWRKKKLDGLKQLPKPKKLSELRKKEYVVTVHRDSMSHHFLLGDLGVPEERIIPCDSAEETIERIVMSKIPRPAHILLTDAPHASIIRGEHSKEMDILFSEEKTSAVPYEDTVAIRPDWDSAIESINEILEFLTRNGSLHRLYRRTIEPKKIPGIII